ncbi:hypothetical protein MRX96_050179 [Rhipicephalus microplus]
MLCSRTILVALVVLALAFTFGVGSVRDAEALAVEDLVAASVGAASEAAVKSVVDSVVDSVVAVDLEVGFGRGGFGGFRG